MSTLRIFSSALVIMFMILDLAGCGTVSGYGSAPIISGVPPGSDVRKEEARALAGPIPRHEDRGRSRATLLQARPCPCGPVWSGL